MYYRLYGKVCDVIENADTLEEAKMLLVSSTKETEEMCIGIEE